MTTPPVESEEDVRVRQTLVLRTLASRLSQGDQILPADVMSRLAEELELRVDEEAVAKAWAEQGTNSPHAWRGERARESRRSRGRDVRQIWILARAERDLEAFDAQTRDDVSLEIDALAFDPLPRGAAALHGRKDDHMGLHIGVHRLLYKVQADVITIVAVTSYE